MSVVIEGNELASRFELATRDVQPFIASNELATVLVTGNSESEDEGLLQFVVPENRCAILTRFSLRSRPRNTVRAAPDYPQGFEEFFPRLDALGWLNAAKVLATTATGNVIRKVPLKQINDAPIYVAVAPGATVSFALYADSPDAAEDIELWLVDVRVEGYLLPASSLEDATRSNTLFM
jgi:hypothetical protein